MEEKKIKALAAELAKDLKTESDLNQFSRILTSSVIVWTVTYNQVAITQNNVQTRGLSWITKFIYNRHKFDLLVALATQYQEQLICLLIQLNKHTSSS
ncbi:hypothetical protein [Photorhabdus australis]|uniref:hypothetical protein n=1 Tax=Photorhabdus australis TaxID=286156 RepID=UPI000560C47A|nr:hypothetical protein [Photorhabdus australis]